MMFRTTRAAAGMVLAMAAISAARAADLPTIDYSHTGYGGGGRSVVATASVLSVKPTGGDDTQMLQAAIDEASMHAMFDSGARGVLLTPGEYKVSGQLRIRESWVMLRGADRERVVVRATGRDRRPLILIRPEGEPVTAPAAKLAADAPAGAMVLKLADLAGIEKGAAVVIARPSTKEWIASLNSGGGDVRSGWQPGSRDTLWDRTVTAVDPAANTITLDAPITCALEAKFGGATVAKRTGAGLLEVGVENMTLLSDAADSGGDRDNHAWTGIRIDHAQNAWVLNVTAKGFVGAGVWIGPRARQVTVENCAVLDPGGWPAGYRRLNYMVEGQQVLVRNCTSENGMDDFALGLCAAGPNVFLNCTAKGALGASGPYESWATGVLYENVAIEGQDLRLAQDRRTQTASWTAGNSVAWNCTAKTVEAKGPASAPNVAGKGDPLYETLLKKRGLTLPALREPVKAEAVAAFAWKGPKKMPAPPRRIVSATNGYFTLGGKALWSGQVNEGWWKGSASPATALAQGGISMSRWMPGREGFGMTENQHAVADRMAAEHVSFYASIPGLWYDRRRDEHSVTQRTDPYAWAPFLELPWARTGPGAAWDGLPKYDLTKFNEWYFDRYRAWADLCDQRGIVFVHHLYDTHDLLEIPQHWIDYPFRPANNINETGLPEPPPADGATGTKNFRLANEVFNVDSPNLRAYHKAFILHTLDALGDKENVIFSVAFQYVGPLKFQQFFQDTVAEWEAAHHRKIKVALIMTKDVTDAILADGVRSKQVALVDMRYWQYRPDGTLFAPEGGKNIAFRESVQRTLKNGSDHPPPTSPEMAYKQVREYRDKYPAIPLVAWNNGVGQVPSFMAGAAQVMVYSPAAGHNQVPGGDKTPLDTFLQQELAGILPTMKPADGLTHNDEGATWALADAKRENLVLYTTGKSIHLSSAVDAQPASARWFNLKTGQTTPLKSPLENAADFNLPGTDPHLLILTHTKAAQ